MPIVSRQIQGTPCPSLGPVPACYVVLAAYVFLLVSALLVQPWRAYVFVPAWLLVFVIAALATGFELFMPNTCPTSMIAVPSCFLSLAMAFLLAIAYRTERHFDKLED